MKESHFFRWILAITLIAAALRLFLLTQPGVVSDELSSVRDAVKLYQDPINTSIRSVKFFGYLPVGLGLYLNDVDLLQVDPMNPTFWQEQGITPWAMRIIPAIIGIIAIPVLGFASKRVLGAHTALIISLLLACSPWHIFWSQFARFYITQFLFYSLALLFYYIASRQGSKRYLILSMSCVLLAFLSQLTAAVFFFIIALDWLVNRRVLKLDSKALLIIFITFALIVGLILLSVLGNLHGWNKDFVQSSGIPPLTFALSTLKRVGFPIMIVGLLAVFARREQAMYLIFAAVIPVIVFSALSFRANASPRYAFMCLFPWIALAGITVDWIRQLKSGMVFSIAVLSFLLFGALKQNYKYYFVNKGYRRPWNLAADYIKQQGELGKKVYFRPKRAGQYHLGARYTLIERKHITREENGVWIVLREKDYALLSKDPDISKVKKCATFFRRKSRKKPSEVSVFYAD